MSAVETRPVLVSVRLVWEGEVGMGTNAQVRLVKSEDDRRLRIEVAGNGDRVILAHVGTPNAGVLFEPWVADAAARGLSLVTYDRPGYGGSSSRPGRTVADCVTDIRAIAEALGFSRCAVWGFSGGGPHALACGALAADLVAAVATIGSPAPPDASGLDYLAGMSDEAREDQVLFRTDRAGWERVSAQQREASLALTTTGARRFLVGGQGAGRRGGAILRVRHLAAWRCPDRPGPGHRRVARRQRGDLLRPVGFRAGVDRRPRQGLARRPGPLRALHARPLARRAHPGRHGRPERGGRAFDRRRRTHRRRPRMAVPPPVAARQMIRTPGPGPPAAARPTVLVGCVIAHAISVHSA